MAGKKENPNHPPSEHEEKVDLKPGEATTEKLPGQSRMPGSKVPKHVAEEQLKRGQQYLARLLQPVWTGWRYIDAGEEVMVTQDEYNPETYLLADQNLQKKWDDALAEGTAEKAEAERLIAAERTLGK